MSLYALWGGMPRYWELAQSALTAGADLPEAVDALVLDPAGPLHSEPDRLFLEETPPALALRPLLDVIGAGAHRASEIAGRLERPASSLSRPLATLAAMQLVRRETPFGTSPRTTKRALYRIDDHFCASGFALSRRIAPSTRKRRLRRASAIGNATARLSKPMPSRSSAAWPCRRCIAATSP